MNLGTVYLKIFEERIQSINDRIANRAFIQDIENSFPQREIKFLDWGCLRGTLVREFLQRGHAAIGLEVIEQYLGAWPELQGTRLFTYDPTHEFSLTSDDLPKGQRVEFDVALAIHMADLIPAQNLPLFFENIRNHLKIGGFVVGSISLMKPFPQNTTLQLWQNRILRNLKGFRFIDYPYQHIPYPAFTSFYYMLSRTS